MKNKSIRNIIAAVVMVVLSFGIILCTRMGKEKASNQEAIEVGSYTNDSAEVKSAAKLLNDKDEVDGYVVTVSSVGFNQESPIVMEITFDVDKTTVKGFKVVEQAETAGLGATIAEDSFTSELVGLTAPVSTADMDPASSSFDQVTGATFSSKAVANGINAANDFLATIQ